MSAFPQTIDFDRIKSMLSQHIGDKNLILTKSTEAYRILSSTDDNGFFIISSGEESDVSVLGYSDTGFWDESAMPPALLQWLSDIEESVRVAPRNISKTKNDVERKNIPALMKSKWHQDSPYNDMCPVIPDGNIKTAAGCVAIAASQVAYYWRKDNPQSTSEDTPIYPYGKAPVTYSVPAGTDFQWDLMRDYYTSFESEEEKEAVARLVYIMGTSTYLNYGTSTGGQTNDIINPFNKQFRLNAKYATKNNYSQEEWEQLIYNNLIHKQPVVYSGSTGNEGHAVVIDGYNANLNLFHFNFGWGGTGDGYYTIDNLTGMNGYTLGQQCVYDIYPYQRNMEIILDVADGLYADFQGQLNLSIRNGSSFSIENLYLFISMAFAHPTNKEEAIWSYIGDLKNDNSEHRFTITFTPHYSGSRFFLFLTDGQMNILTQRSISIQDGTGVRNILDYDNTIDNYYSIKGEVLPQKPSSGVFIKRRGNTPAKKYFH